MLHSVSSASQCEHHQDLLMGQFFHSDLVFFHSGSQTWPSGCLEPRIQIRIRKRFRWYQNLFVWLHLLITWYAGGTPRSPYREHVTMWHFTSDMWQCHMSDVTCHMSHVTRHMSLITCDMWHVISHMSCWCQTSVSSFFQVSMEWRNLMGLNRPTLWPPRAFFLSTWEWEVKPSSSS